MLQTAENITNSIASALAPAQLVNQKFPFPFEKKDWQLELVIANSACSRPCSHIWIQIKTGSSD